MNAMPTGTETRDNKAILQSRKSRKMNIRTGVRILLESSGRRCASGLSIVSTWSTIICFSFPEGVSIIVPRGRRGSLSRIAARIFLIIWNVALCESESAFEYMMLFRTNAAKAIIADVMTVFAMIS